MRVEELHQPQTNAAVMAATTPVATVSSRLVVPLVKALVLVGDVVVAVGCFLLAFNLREDVSVLREIGGFAWSQDFAPYCALLPFVVLVRVLPLLYYDMYRLRGEFSFVQDGVRIFKAVAVGSLLIVAAAFLYRGGFEYRTFSYARGVFLLDFLLAFTTFIVLRLLLRFGQTFARQHDANLIHTIVVGRESEAALCVQEMRHSPSLGYRVIGIIDTEPQDESTDKSFEGVPIIGTLEDLSKVIRETNVNEVIVTDPRVSRDLLFDVMMSVGRRRGIEFRIAPNLFNCLPRKTEIDQIGTLPMIRLFREPLSNTARVAKRISDLVIAAIALCVLAPLWIVLAVLIKLDSRGRVFYKQERVGMDGRLFMFYKFRTMHENSDDDAHREFQRRYIAGLPETNLGDDERPVYKLRTDPRITRTGRWLRQWSLDELPQLINVLRGDMSIVGPRPPIPYEVNAYELPHRRRLDMKPGITGLWQVSGRNRLPFDEMVRRDIYYIENWSLWLDLMIILRTLPVMLRGTDAY